MRPTISNWFSLAPAIKNHDRGGDYDQDGGTDVRLGNDQDRDSTHQDTERNQAYPDVADAPTFACQPGADIDDNDDLCWFTGLYAAAKKGARRAERVGTKCDHAHQC